MSDRAVWNQEYARGQWDRLNDSAELAHTSVIVGWLNRHSSTGAVLDVGCGDGVLAAMLPGRPYRGLDLSDVAIAKAAARGLPNATFDAADAATAEPGGRYQAIVFNECVYYFADPVGTVQRYRRFLEPGGIIVVSVFRSAWASTIVSRLARCYPVLDETTVRNRRGSWLVRVYAPDSASTAGVTGVGAAQRAGASDGNRTRVFSLGS